MDSLVMMTVLLLAGLHLNSGSSVQNEIHRFVPIPETGPTEMTSEPEGVDLDEVTDFLTELLIENPWKTVGDPLVYVAAPDEDEGGVASLPRKRSRYYRRYPWKRQHGRDFDPDDFICSPSRGDVFQLLIALHGSKVGHERDILFCNRRKPARAVLANLRFMGRRK